MLASLLRTACALPPVRCAAQRLQLQGATALLHQASQPEHAPAALPSHAPAPLALAHLARQAPSAPHPSAPLLRLQRLFSSRASPPPPPTISAASLDEQEVAQKLASAFQASRIEVEDVSGGCGAMYRIVVEAHDFKGQSIVKQHQAVAAVLKEDIAKWHGMRLTTKAAP